MFSLSLIFMLRNFNEILIVAAMTIVVRNQK